MRNLIKVLTVLGCCLLGVVTGVVGVQAAAPTVTTTTITAITSTTATSGGNVTDSGGVPVTARGVCWSTSSNPTTADSITTNGTGEGAFVSSITGLNPGTTYHVRAYATNSVGTSYGDDSTFTTLPTPTLTTKTITAITCQSATCGGNVTSDGGDSITARGVCWSTSANPVVSDSHTVNDSDTGSFVSSITGLTSNTLYHVRAYATNSGGTSYGGDSTFTTSIGMPIVTTKTITSVNSTTASGGGYVTSDCGDSVTARGVCWYVYANPTTEYPRTIDGSDTGSFTSTLTGLELGTLYHVRAYATNSLGTSYGGDSTFILRICTISGYVRNSDGVGMGGVVMSGLPDDPQTNGYGFYTATVGYGWSGTVKPTDSSCVFLPESTFYAGVVSDESDRNYLSECFAEDVDPEKDNLVPNDFQLTQNSPNPFNPSTEIVFGLPKAGHVTLIICNIVGQKVITLVDRNLSAGTYRVRWNGVDGSGRLVSSGVYFYRMQSGDFAQTKQMLLLK